VLVLGERNGGGGTCRRPREGHQCSGPQPQLAVTVAFMKGWIRQ